jgi:hypothetical protein
MSVVKVTRDSISVVCLCGAQTEYSYDDVIVSPVAVQFPLCQVCKKNISGVIANPYSASWENEPEEVIKRQVIGQIVHKFALENDKSTKKYGTKESILRQVSVNGNHNAVPENVEVFEAEPPKHEKFAVEHFKKTGKPFIKVKEKPVSSVPKESKVLEVLSGKKE